jgi:hypothetical protein
LDGGVAVFPNFRVEAVVIIRDNEVPGLAEILKFPHLVFVKRDRPSRNFTTVIWRVILPTGIGIVPMTVRMLSSILINLPCGKTFHSVKGWGMTNSMRQGKAFWAHEGMCPRSMRAFCVSSI